MFTEGRLGTGELSSIIIIDVIWSLDEHVICHLFSPQAPLKITQIISLTELQGYVNVRIYSLSLMSVVSNGSVHIWEKSIKEQSG